MIRWLCLAALVCIVAVGTGCASYRAPVIPPVGIAFTDYRAPMTPDLVGQKVSSKHGEATTQSVLGLFAWGDCSIEAASKAGNLNTINYADYSFFNVLGVYQKFTITAYGE